MRFNAIFVLSIAAIFFLAACGGGETTVVPTQQPTKLPESQTPEDLGTLVPTQQPTKLPDSQASADLGTLEIRVTDQPAEAATSIVVTVKNIEVHVFGDGGDAGWLTVIAEPRKFDLVKLRGIEEILGSATLEPGRYQQIRLEVAKAVVTIRGNERAAAIPSEKLRLVGGFDVTAGVTTILTLDFDAERSIVFRPGVGPQLKPVVKLLVRSGSQSLADASIVAAPGEVATPTPPATPEAGPDAIRVVIPTGDNLQFMSFWTALGAGFFGDEGLDVVVIVPPNPLGTGQFLLQGRAEIGVLPPPMYLPLIAEEEPILVFANLLQNDSINLIVRKEVTEERQLSPDAPLAEKLNAMQGLRVGVAPGPPVRLRLLFKSVGLDADKDVEMVIIHGASQNDAFSNGTIDALYAHTPYLEEALVGQEAVLIVNQSAGEVPELTNRQMHSLVTTQSYASANPEVLVALTRALHRAQQLVHTDQLATAGAILNSGIQRLEPERLKTIIAIYEPAIPPTPEVSVDGALKALELFPDHQTPPDLSGIDLTIYVDPQFAQQAVASNP